MQPKTAARINIVTILAGIFIGLFQVTSVVAYTLIGLAIWGCIGLSTYVLYDCQKAMEE